MLKKLKDIDFLFEWGTWIFLCIFMVKPAIHSEMFIFYLILSLIRIKREGYKRTRLEPYMALAMLGFAISYIGNPEPKMGKYLLAQLKTFLFPIFIYQFDRFKNLENKFFYFFSGLSIYGLFQVLYLKSHQVDINRYYSYMDFFMDSSIMALIGYIYTLLYGIKSLKINWSRALISFIGGGNFIFLILSHQVRATYISFTVINILLIIYFVKKIKNKKKYLYMLSIVTSLGIGGIFLKNSSIFKMDSKYISRIESISDMNNHSNSARLNYWRIAFEIFKENPINGIGFRKFNKNNLQINKRIEEEFRWSFTHAHSEFFGLLAEVGVIGIGLWYLFKLMYIKKIYIKKEEFFGQFILCAMIVFEIQNFFESYIVNRNMYRLIFILVALGLNKIREEKKLEDESGTGIKTLSE